MDESGRMEAKHLLARYFYLGQFRPILCNENVSVDDIKLLVTRVNHQDVAEALGALQHVQNLDVIYSFLARYLARTDLEPVGKVELLKTIAVSMSNGERYFTFVKHSADLRKEANKRGFSKTTRKVIELWYHGKMPHNLAEMLCVNFGMFGWTHADVIKLCHINCNKLGSNAILCKTAFNRKIEGVFSDGVRMTKLQKVFELRRFEGDPKVVKDMIETYNLTIDNIPTYLLRSKCIFRNLISKMTPRLIMKNLLTFHDMKLLRHKENSQALVDRLSAEDLFNDCVMKTSYPIIILLTIRKYEKQSRYIKPVKKKFYDKKIKKNQLQPKKSIITAMYKALENSFKNLRAIIHHYPICVTINLQQNYKHKKVFGFEQMSCLDASIALGYSLYCSGTQVTVLTFDESSVRPIPWSKGMDFKKASELCTENIKKRNIARLERPIVYATENAKKFNLFITIVSSSCLGSKKHKAPTQCWEAYRKTINPDAKCVIISLKRRKPGLHHEPYVDTGFLEISGMTEEALTIIEAFRDGLFK